MTTKQDMVSGPVLAEPWGLRGRKALITGAASGIGQSIATALVGVGVEVLIADRRPGDETLELITEMGGQATYLAVDLRFEDQVERLVGQALDHLGSIELFVNVAGVYNAEAVTALSTGAWSEQFAVNVTACALICRSLLPHMIAAGRGSILIVGSTVVCVPSYAGAAYRASKVALRSYMETLAVELAPFAIRVNMLTPGPFPTRLNDVLPSDQRRASAREVPLHQREGRIDEVRGPALFLLSDELASYVTGTEVFVDGGLHLRPLYLPPEDVERLNAPPNQLKPVGNPTRA
jgi:NAD(P)-dependent dehydrogenase (short-subunit alcohol dehydrogenase family)